MSKHKQLATLLLTLEEVLRASNLWANKPVDSQLLKSTQPFCHDVLSTNEWLQFVFIKKLEQLTKLSLPLPKNCDITPYVSESMKELSNVDDITKVTKQIDDLLSK